MTERWAAVAGTDGLYEVSDWGRVRRAKTQRLLRPRQRGGYLRVSIGPTSARRDVNIHRLVLEAFVGYPEDGQEANHINGDKWDNSVWNLEWVTRSENIRHAQRTGLKPPSRGEANGRSKLTWDQARAIRTSTGRVRDVGREYGVSGFVVSQIRRGLLWREDIDITNPRWREIPA